MQYQVPQFIEIEDKIFGPLTFKQFVYCVGGGAVCFLAYRFLPFFIAIFIIVPVGGLSLALAFYKMNNRPFIFILESAIRYFTGKKLYIWKRSETKPEEVSDKPVVDASKVLVPKLSNSKLRDLTWSLDINDTVFSKETGFQSRDEIHPKDDGIASFRGLSTDITAK